MNFRLIDATTGNVVETFTDLPNAPMTRTAIVNPGVGAFQFKIQAMCDPAKSGGGAVYGASMVATQGKR
ncbi:MAG: hypothetical protein JWO51_2436 [Rhodospirillales bacterium]|nr:hypothetical protein [Rhodospirillales bacterium]